MKQHILISFGSHFEAASAHLAPVARRARHRLAAGRSWAGCFPVCGIRQLLLALVFAAAATTLMLSTLVARAGPFLVASDYQGSMRKVDPENGAIIGTLSGGSRVGEIDIGPDGLIYASVFESSLVRKIDPNTGLAAGTINLPGKPRDVAFGTDGKLYIALTGDGSGHGSIGVYQYDLTSQQLNKYNASTLNGSPIGIAFGPGNDLFVCLDARYSGNGAHSIMRIDGQTGMSEGVFTDVNISIPQSLAFGPNGNLYVGNQGTSSVTQYASDGTYLGTLIASAGNTQGLYFLPDGDLIFGQGGSRFVRYDFPLQTLSTFSAGYSFSHSMILIPEPSTLVLLGVGALGLLACAWRRRWKLGEQTGTFHSFITYRLFPCKCSPITHKSRMSPFWN